jgi:ribosomal protein S20
LECGPSNILTTEKILENAKLFDPNPMQNSKSKLNCNVNETAVDLKDYVAENDIENPQGSAITNLEEVAKDQLNLYATYATTSHDEQNHTNELPKQKSKEKLKGSQSSLKKANSTKIISEKSASVTGSRLLRSDSSRLLRSDSSKRVSEAKPGEKSTPKGSQSHLWNRDKSNSQVLLSKSKSSHQSLSVISESKKQAEHGHQQLDGTKGSENPSSGPAPQSEFAISSVLQSDKRGAQVSNSAHEDAPHSTQDEPGGKDNSTKVVSSNSASRNPSRQNLSQAENARGSKAKLNDATRPISSRINATISTSPEKSIVNADDTGLMLSKNVSQALGDQITPNSSHAHPPSNRGPELHLKSSVELNSGGKEKLATGSRGSLSILADTSDGRKLRQSHSQLKNEHLRSNSKLLTSSGSKSQQGINRVQSTDPSYIPLPASGNASRTLLASPSVSKSNIRASGIIASSPLSQTEVPHSDLPNGADPTSMALPPSLAGSRVLL